MAHNETTTNSDISDITGLPNRRALMQNLIRMEHKHPGNFGLLTVDVDELKRVNDTQGHDAGNSLLHRAGQVMSDSIRIEPADTVSERRLEGDQVVDVLANHIHGDEFVIILPGIQDPETLELVRQRIVRNLDVAGIGASIGGRVHQPGETIENLLHDSDFLMIKEKNLRRKARFNQLPRRKKIASKLGHALIKYAGVNAPRL